MDPTFWATISSVIVAVTAVIVAYAGLKRQLEQNRSVLEQNFAILGAQSAIEWREQVFDLHDRGLNPGEIRYIMYLEHGGQGYEKENGLIDEVVRNVPRRVSTDLSDPPDESERRTAPRPDDARLWGGEF